MQLGFCVGLIISYAFDEKPQADQSPLGNNIYGVKILREPLAQCSGMNVEIVDAAVTCCSSGSQIRCFVSH